MIRFSAALVVVGLGLLLAGAITSEMALVYAAIAVSVCAALVLAAGMIAGRHELFGRGATAAGDERTFYRGVTPGPGTPAIPGDAAGAGLLSVGDRGAAAFSAQAGSVGPSYTGVGWPSAKSPADELWARVDAELAAAGAAARTPKLTKESTSDEVWGRVEQELSGPAQWGSRVVIPAAEEAGPAEREPAVEGAADSAWADPAAWTQPVGWSEGANQAGTAEASTAAGQVANRAQHLAPAEAAPDHAEAVAAGAEAGPDSTQAGPDSTQAVPDSTEAVATSTDVAPDSAEARPADAEAGPAGAEAGPAGAEAMAAGANVIPDSTQAGPASAEAAPDSAEAGPAGAQEAGPGDAVAAADSAETASNTRTPDENADQDPAGTAPAGTAAAGPAPAGPAPAGTAAAGVAAAGPAPGIAPVSPPATGDHGDHAPAVASEQAQAPEAPAAEPGRDPAPGLLPAPPAAQMMPAAFREHGEARSAAEAATVLGHVIVVSGVPRYHRPGCILIRFLGQDDMESITREAAEASGCVPCRACQPDKLPSAAESGIIG